MSGANDCPRCGADMVLPERVCIICLTAENARLRGEVEALMSSDMNERPADFRATICRVDGHPCEGQGTDTDCNACTAELRRLQDVERLWCEACEVARTHCPVGIGESHIRQGIPRLAQRIAALTADLARVTVERDALLTAAQATIDTFEPDDPHTEPTYNTPRGDARAAPRADVAAQRRPRAGR